MFVADFLSHSSCFREVALSESACGPHYRRIMSQAAANRSAATNPGHPPVLGLCWSVRIIYTHVQICCAVLKIGSVGLTGYPVG